MPIFILGEYTIFAPTNAAFSKLPQSTLDGLQRDTTALANILKYNVVKGSIHKADASNELQLETLAGTKIRINIYPHNNVCYQSSSKFPPIYKDKHVLHFKIWFVIGSYYWGIPNHDLWSHGHKWNRSLDRHCHDAPYRKHRRFGCWKQWSQHSSVQSPVSWTCWCSLRFVKYWIIQIILIQ